MIAKGQVVDSKSLVSIPGVTIAEYTPVNCITAPCNDILVDGTTTDVNGMFQKQVQQGNVVRVSAIGYQTVQPLFHDNILEKIHLVQKAYDVPTATVTGSRTYYKYYLAALVVAVSVYIYYKG